MPKCHRKVNSFDATTQVLTLIFRPKVNLTTLTFKMGLNPKSQTCVLTCLTLTEIIWAETHVLPYFIDQCISWAYLAIRI